MKLKRLLLSLSLLPFAASCSPLYHIISSDTGLSSDPSPISSSDPSGTIEKRKLAYTYHDYNDYYAFAAPICPVSGSPKILVIPVWFSDSSTYVTSETNKENVRSDISRAFFGTDTGWESVASFFNKESGGLLTFSGTVSSWYETSYSHIEANANFESIIKGAVEWYFESNPTEDRTSYDIDKDGYLDMVSLIYACPDYKGLQDPSLSQLWAFSPNLSSFPIFARLQKAWGSISPNPS